MALPWNKKSLTIEAKDELLEEFAGQISRNKISKVLRATMKILEKSKLTYQSFAAPSHEEISTIILTEHLTPNMQLLHRKLVFEPDQNSIDAENDRLIEEIFNNPQNNSGKV